MKNLNLSLLAFYSCLLLGLLLYPNTVKAQTCQSPTNLGVILTPPAGHMSWTAPAGPTVSTYEVKYITNLNTSTFYTTATIYAISRDTTASYEIFSVSASYPTCSSLPTAYTYSKEGLIMLIDEIYGHIKDGQSNTGVADYCATGLEGTPAIVLCVDPQKIAGLQKGTVETTTGTICNIFDAYNPGFTFSTPEDEKAAWINTNWSVSLAGSATPGFDFSGYSQDHFFPNEVAWLDHNECHSDKSIIPRSGGGGNNSGGGGASGGGSGSGHTGGGRRDGIHLPSLDWSISPNPFSDYVTVKIYTAIESQPQLQLLDMMGRVVKRDALSASPTGYELRLDNTALASGMYQLVVTIGKQSFSKKIIKQ